MEIEQYWTGVPTLRATHVINLNDCLRVQEENQMETHCHVKTYTEKKQRNFKLYDAPDFKCIGLVAGKYTSGYHDFHRIIDADARDFQFNEPNDVKIEDIQNVIETIERLREDTKQKCDYICIVRGGGDLEIMHRYWNSDLLTTIQYTQEVYNIPVITGIGHETDHPFCERVAKYAAATPTHAAYFFKDVKNRHIRERKSIPMHDYVIGRAIPTQRSSKDDEIAELHEQVRSYQHDIEMLQQQLNILRGI